MDGASEGVAERIRGCITKLRRHSRGRPVDSAVNTKTGYI